MRFTSPRPRLCAYHIPRLAGLRTLILKVFPPHQDVTGNPWMYISIFFLLGGLQLICMGLLGEISIRTYYESQKKPIYTIRETPESKDPAQASGP